MEKSEKKWKKKVGPQLHENHTFSSHLITHDDTRRGGFDKLRNPIPQIRVGVCTRQRQAGQGDNKTFYILDQFGMIGNFRDALFATFLPLVTT